MSSARPTPLSVRADGIPEALRVERRWVGWRYAKRDGRWTKTPCVATAPATGADSTDAQTWRSFDEALAAYEDGKVDGIGFVLGDGFVGFDADDDEAREHLRLLNTYAERSPSGEGVHAICRGAKPGPKCRVGNLELYEQGRYFTVTGHHLPGTPPTVEERPAEIAALYAKMFPNGNGRPAETSSGNALTDDALVARARASKNGEKFGALWNGDTSGYTSHSEADMALCSMLAFWTNRDAARIDRLFRQSRLMRPKWDERRGASTYGQDVIQKAIASTQKGYTGAAPDIVVRKATDVPDETLVKAFGGRLVLGSITLLAGPGESGKGMFCVETFARFTTGAPFPGEAHGRQPANVLMCVTEDSTGRVKARLRAAGADLDRVYFVDGPEMTRGGLTMPSPMMLDDDAGALVKHAQQLDARALFLETVVEHFGDRGGKASRRSTHNEADVRAALSPFRAVCQAAGLYGLGVIHPRKSVEGSIEDSISGSAAFRNVTRAAHHVYHDPEDESDDRMRLLFTSKANYLARRPPTLRFRIRSWDEERGVPCSCHEMDCGHEGRVVWEGDLVDKRTAEEVWKQLREHGRPRRDVAVQEAEAFLVGLMQDGKIEMPPEEIFKMARGEGNGKSAVNSAKRNLGLVSVKEKGFPARVVAWAVRTEEF